MNAGSGEPPVFSEVQSAHGTQSNILPGAGGSAGGSLPGAGGSQLADPPGGNTQV